MKDSLSTLGGQPFPSEELFRGKCESLGGSFTDSDFKMSCDLPDETVEVGISPHEGPWVKAQENGKKIGSMSVDGAEVPREGNALVVGKLPHSRGQRGDIGDYITIN